MSIDELKERIKEEVVLREGDLFEWQWRQLGLVAEANELGIAEADFLTIVNEVSRAIHPFFGRISDLKVKITDLARIQRKKLTTAQVDQIVADAVRLQLPPDFVRDRWLPAILANVPEPAETPNAPDSAAPASVASPDAANEAVIPTVAPQSSSRPTPSQATPVEVDREAVARKVHQFLNEYATDNYLPARVLKPLFLATNFDENILAEAVLAYLSANFYAAEIPVTGQTLHDKLLSTDWRHLSWWNTAPASAAQPAPQPQRRPAKRGQSDSTVIGMALLAVGLLIGGAWWITRDKPAQKPGTTISSQYQADTVPKIPKKKKSRKKNTRSTTSQP